MLRTTLKNLLGHKLRLALTTVSVVLGVSFIVGTLVLTDTINATFDRLFGDAERNTSVSVRARADFTTTAGGAEQRAPVPSSLLGQVRAVPGVKEAVGTVEGYAQLVDPHTKKVVENGGAPGLGRAWTGTTLSPLRLTSGRGPSAATEIAIDSRTAEKHRIAVGDTVMVLLAGGPRQEQVVGIFSFGSTGDLAGATLTTFDTVTAQRVLGSPGSYSTIKLAATAGVSQVELRGRVQRVLPKGYEAITGKQAAAENSNSVQSQLKFLNVFLLVFAGISLFVGSFIIFNTFTMLVAQRSREMALLRALGASRRQVTRSVLGESLVVGVVASALGLGVGLGVAKLLKLLLKAFGADIPATGLVLLAHTPSWAFAVGIGVTMAAAYGPARRAAKIPPVAAMRDDVALPMASLRRRAIVGCVLTAGGAVLMGVGLAGASSQPAALVGFGAAAVFWGVRALSPFISRPVVRLLGAPLQRTSGVAGRLARENALRNPRRTAATASALMVGMALVSAMTVMSSSVKASAGEVIDRSLGADFLLTTKTFTPFTNAVAERLRSAPGVAAVSSFRLGEAKVGGSSVGIQGTQPDTVDHTVTLDMLKGSKDALAAGGLLIDEKTATTKKWAVGQQVPVVFTRTGLTSLRVGGIYRENQLLGSYLISTATFERNYTNSLDSIVAVTSAPDVPIAQVRRTVEAAAALSPNIDVRDQAEFKAEQRKQINQVLSFILVLLALAIFIAVLGIINTLALSVFERTREIGLLRAVGMSRRQLRRMVRLESVIISVFGALLGVAVGLGFGWALVTALHDQGIRTLVIPTGSLVGYLVLAGIIGVLAALLPARRAARLDVLRAIATT